MSEVYKPMLLAAWVFCCASGDCGAQTTTSTRPTAEQCARWRAGLDNNVKLSDQGKDAENLFPYCVDQGSGPPSGWFRGYETYEKPPEFEPYQNDIFKWLNKKYQS